MKEEKAQNSRGTLLSSVSVVFLSPWLVFVRRAQAN